MNLGVVFWLAAMFVTAVGAVLCLGFLAERGTPAHGKEVYDWRRDGHRATDDQRKSEIGAVADGGGEINTREGCDE